MDYSALGFKEILVRLEDDSVAVVTINRAHSEYLRRLALLAIHLHSLYLDEIVSVSAWLMNSFASLSS